jgi:hypothetical protein
MGIRDVEVIELDELFTYVKKKQRIDSKTNEMNGEYARI